MSTQTDGNATTESQNDLSSKVTAMVERTTAYMTRRKQAQESVFHDKSKLIAAVASEMQVAKMVAARRAKVIKTLVPCRVAAQVGVFTFKDGTPVPREKVLATLEESLQRPARNAAAPEVVREVRKSEEGGRELFMEPEDTEDNDKVAMSALVVYWKGGKVVDFVKLFLLYDLRILQGFNHLLLQFLVLPWMVRLNIDEILSRPEVLNALAVQKECDLNKLRGLNMLSRDQFVPVPEDRLLLRDLEEANMPAPSSPKSKSLTLLRLDDVVRESIAAATAAGKSAEEIGRVEAEIRAFASSRLKENISRVELVDDPGAFITKEMSDSWHSRLDKLASKEARRAWAEDKIANRVIDLSCGDIMPLEVQKLLLEYRCPPEGHLIRELVHKDSKRVYRAELLCMSYGTHTNLLEGGMPVAGLICTATMELPEGLDIDNPVHRPLARHMLASSLVNCRKAIQEVSQTPGNALKDRLNKLLARSGAGEILVQRLDEVLQRPNLGVSEQMIVKGVRAAVANDLDTSEDYKTQNDDSPYGDDD